jgi:hypothetical protein
MTCSPPLLSTRFCGSLFCTPSPIVMSNLESSESPIYALICSATTTALSVSLSQSPQFSMIKNEYAAFLTLNYLTTLFLGCYPLTA